MDTNRRDFLKQAGFSTLTLMFPQIVRALSIPANVRTGTIEDVEHVVIFMQENRSFDHYFGSMAAVKGYADPYPVPASPLKNMAQRTVMSQYSSEQSEPKVIGPFPLNTRQDFNLMRVEGTPHNWHDAQAAWDEGRLGNWPQAKNDRSIAYYERDDIPFQYALAEAFTLCDAYHCSVMAGTNPNRVFLWTGTNDGKGLNGGPVLGNSHCDLPENGGAKSAYTFNSYVERLDAASIEWAIYQDMKDNFGCNPLVGFKNFRDSLHSVAGSNPRLAQRALSSRKLDQLKADVLADKLPAVSYIVSTEEGSEHPGPSSPAQGAAYTAEVLDALTANPDVWSKTVLIITFDENDGFFDHVPPPAPPSKDVTSPTGLAGLSQVSTDGEYHEVRSQSDAENERDVYMGRPYGLGPRVPAYIISPWTRGGYINSEVLDHTSVIRFLEARFGVHEPNISPWRRAVCGDLVNAFDFKNPNNHAFPKLPDPREDASRAALLSTTAPKIPAQVALPKQELGYRPHCPCVYDLDVEWQLIPAKKAIQLKFCNKGKRAAVFHIYDRENLKAIPHRYTILGGSEETTVWQMHSTDYDLQIMGPENFHRRLAGNFNHDKAEVEFSIRQQSIAFQALNQSLTYHTHESTTMNHLNTGEKVAVVVDADNYYDVTMYSVNQPKLLRQFSGRLITQP